MCVRKINKEHFTNEKIEYNLLLQRFQKQQLPGLAQHVAPERGAVRGCRELFLAPGSEGGVVRFVAVVDVAAAAAAAAGRRCASAAALLPSSSTSSAPSPSSSFTPAVVEIPGDKGAHAFVRGVAQKTGEVIICRAKDNAREASFFSFSLSRGRRRRRERPRGAGDDHRVRGVPGRRHGDERDTSRGQAPAEARPASHGGLVGKRGGADGERGRRRKRGVSAAAAVPSSTSQEQILHLPREHADDGRGDLRGLRRERGVVEVEEDEDQFWFL